MAIKVTGIDHIHFNTRNIRKFTGLMRELFDLDAGPLGHFVPLEFYNMTLSVKGAPMFEGPPFLDCFEPTGINGPIGREMLERGEGISYISFRVVDIDAAADHAKACGLKEISRIGFGKGMQQVQFDTIEQLGFRLEFVEYGPDWKEEVKENNARMQAGESVDGMRYVDDASPL